MPLEICREDEEAAIKIYQKLITQLPSLNRQLLLYLLDLLAVFAAKSDVNLMNAANLAAIFQPGMLSHRVHDMAPKEYRLSQDVVIFLIDTQDNFLIGMDGTASEEMSKADMTATSSTARDQVISGPQASDNQTTPLAFNMAPAAADVKRFGGLRRNASAASKTSSAGPSVPGSPAPNSRPTSTFGAGGVHRSNTAPSRRPATIGTSKQRFSRSPEPASPRSFRESSPKSVAETSPSTGLTPQQSQPSVAALASEMRPETNDTHQPVQHESDPTNGRPQGAGTIPQPQSSPIMSQNVQPQSPKLPSIAPVAPSTSMRSIDQESMHLNLPPPPTHIFGISPAKGTSTPPGEKRSLSAFFSKSPTSDAERSERRETNKLRKRKKEARENGAAQASAQSSTSTVHLDIGRPPEEGRLE